MGDRRQNDSERFDREPSLRHPRNRFESINESHRFIYSDPSWLSKLLDCTLNDEIGTFDELVSRVKKGFHNGQISEDCINDIENCTKELGEMISTDPRLGDLLDREFLMCMFQLLKRKQSPTIQAHAATILKYVVIFFPHKDEVGDVIEYMTPVVLDLICSRIGLVRVKALWLLRNLVFTISKSSIEEALDHLISIIFDDSIGHGVLHAASKTLLSVCDVHPKLPREKLKLAVSALIKLANSNVLTSLISGCWGLARLCDGREEMIVEDGDLKCLIRRLVYVMNSDERVMIICGFHALGSIARWGSDDVIEAIIKDEGALRILSILIEEGDMYLVKQSCWIVSNITARKQRHIEAVIDVVTDCKLIDPLVNVLHNCKLNYVVKEALWAISNAMCGAGPFGIRRLSQSCSNLLWDDLLFSFKDDMLFVLVVLEGLVNIDVAQVTWGGQLIDGLLLRYIFQSIVHDSGFFTKCCLPFCGGNAHKIDSGGYELIFRFYGSLKFFVVRYDSSTKDLTAELVSSYRRSF